MSLRCSPFKAYPAPQHPPATTSSCCSSCCWCSFSCWSSCSRRWSWEKQLRRHFVGNSSMLLDPASFFGLFVLLFGWLCVEIGKCQSPCQKNVCLKFSKEYQLFRTKAVYPRSRDKNTVLRAARDPLARICFTLWASYHPTKVLGKQQTVGMQALYASTHLRHLDLLKAARQRILRIPKRLFY